MNHLIRFFWSLSLLRRAPQDLPASPWLMGLMLALNLLINTLLGLAVFVSPPRSMLAALLDLMLSAGLLFAALQIRGHPGRWLQAYTGLLGIGVVLGGLGLAYRLLSSMLGVPGVAAMLDLGLFFWSILVMGHILRHALDIGLPFAILIVFAYTMFLFGLTAQWLAPELQAR